VLRAGGHVRESGADIDEQCRVWQEWNYVAKRSQRRTGTAKKGIRPSDICHRLNAYIRRRTRIVQDLDAASPSRGRRQMHVHQRSICA
jgi:hypothetical protein